MASLQKAEDDELLRVLARNATRHQIEKFFRFDLAARGSVRATHIIRFDSSPGALFASASSLSRRLRTF
jgi:hypothetical protein